LAATAGFETGPLLDRRSSFSEPYAVTCFVHAAIPDDLRLQAVDGFDCMGTGRRDGSLRTPIIRTGHIPVYQVRHALQPFKDDPASLPDASVLFKEAQSPIDQVHHVTNDLSSTSFRPFDLFARRRQRSNDISPKL
jgi:hypothetical protein